MTGRPQPSDRGERLVLTAPTDHNRLDLFIASARPELSRSRVGKLIAAGLVSLEGRPAKPSAAIRAGQTVEVIVPPPQPIDLEPEPIPLTIVYEDDDLIVIDKPAGLVVHPAAGHDRGTLVHGLLHHLPDLKGVGGEQRPGIVHRLDKDTSGLLVAAKNDAAHQALAAAFQARRVEKTYRAVLLGRPSWAEKTVEAPIGRHPVHRKKMAVRPDGRRAVSRFMVEEILSGPLCLAKVEISTGRTHQIRVHAAHLGHPVAVDPVYASPGRYTKLSGRAKVALAPVDRQLLHAWRLAFDHPTTGKRLELTAPLPDDMAGVIDKTRLG